MHVNSPAGSLDLPSPSQSPGGPIFPPVTPMAATTTVAHSQVQPTQSHRASCLATPGDKGCGTGSPAHRVWGKRPRIDKSLNKDEVGNHVEIGMNDNNVASNFHSSDLSSSPTRSKSTCIESYFSTLPVGPSGTHQYPFRGSGYSFSDVRHLLSGLTLLYLCSGLVRDGNVSDCCRQLGMTAVNYDIEIDPIHHDLLSFPVFESIMDDVTSMKCRAILMSPACSTFSSARSRFTVWNDRGLSEESMHQTSTDTAGSARKKRRP